MVSVEINVEQIWMGFVRRRERTRGQGKREKGLGRLLEGGGDKDALSSIEAGGSSGDKVVEETDLFMGEQG